MTTVISPRLTLDGSFLSTRSNVSYFFRSDPAAFVEVPEAEYYWVEASDKQFKERNGCAVEVKLDDKGYACCRINNKWMTLESVIDNCLKKLGVIVDGPSKKIWFRLWYQE